MDHVHVQPDIRSAWCGPSLLVVNTRGECGENDPLTGYYFREARHLRTLRLEINGARPWPSELAVHDTDRISCGLIHPELTTFGGGGTGRANGDISLDAVGLPYRALDLHLRLSLSAGALDVALTVANRAGRAVEFELAWILDADFADLIAVTGGTAAGDTVRVEVSPRELRFVRENSTLPYATRVQASALVGWRVDDDRLATDLHLGPGRSAELFLRVEPVDPSLPVPNDARERQWRAWRERFTRIACPGNSAVERIIAQNSSDVGSLSLLEGAEDEWLTPQAGVPLYPALFGRDALTATWQAAMLDRGDMLDATLTRLGRLQGTRDDPERDEEPGRIIQQSRSGPLSRTGALPYSAYYGDFASPLMYVISLAHLYAWTGDKKRLEQHWDSARRVLEWARDRGDRDGDGYLEYGTRASQGAQNQGWKDSGDAIVYEDGTLVRGPIATCELQGYWFAAQQLMAVLSWVFDARDDARDYWRDAMALRARFNRDWWLEGEGCVALALDADKRVVSAPGTNAGHCLATGIVAARNIPRLVGRLFESDLFSGWGIRTLSTRHAAYDPVSYHRGSVWAVENATIAFGLRRFGFDARALDLTRALFDLAELYPNGRIPETVGGYARAERPTPGLYPRANPVQLWNASAVPLLVHSVLGLQPVAPLELLIVDPVLPSWLPEVVLHGIRLGKATATIRFWRDAAGASHTETLHKRGTFHVLRQPPPESLNAGLRDRFSALADRVLHH